MVFFKICYIYVCLLFWWIFFKCSYYLYVMCNYFGLWKRCIYLIVYFGGGIVVMLIFMWNIDGEKEIIIFCGEWLKLKYFLLIGFCYDCLLKRFFNFWGNFFFFMKKRYFCIINMMILKFVFSLVIILMLGLVGL